MIDLLIVSGYFLISGFVSRALLHLFMSREVCTIHREGWFTGRCSTNIHTRNLKEVERTTAPYGELAPRSFEAAMVSVLLGLVWPFTVLVLFAYHGKPTSAELTRKNAQLAQKIKDLQSRIDESYGDPT